MVRKEIKDHKRQATAPHLRTKVTTDEVPAVPTHRTPVIVGVVGILPPRDRGARWYAWNTGTRVGTRVDKQCQCPHHMTHKPVLKVISHITCRPIHKDGKYSHYRKMQININTHITYSLAIKACSHSYFLLSSPHHTIGRDSLGQSNKIIQPKACKTCINHPSMNNRALHSHITYSINIISRTLQS